MASAVIHLCIAKKVNETIRLNENELFIGTIAPDISKHIGKSKKDSHFLPHTNTDIPNVKKFYKKYQNDFNNDFTMGYFIHLLTDKYWYENFITDIVTETTIKQSNGKILKMNTKDIDKIIYTDYTNLNIRLIEYYNLSLDIFFNEIETPKSSINEIPMDKLDIIIEKMGAIIRDSKKGKIFALNCQNIIKFIEESSEKIIEELYKLKLIDYKI